jgi:hypothetical protein
MELADSLGLAAFRTEHFCGQLSISKVVPLPSRLALVAYSLWIKDSHTLVACIESPGTSNMATKAIPSRNAVPPNAGPPNQT